MIENYPLTEFNNILFIPTNYMRLETYYILLLMSEKSYYHTVFIYRTSVV